MEQDTEKARKLFETVIAAGYVEGYSGSGMIAYYNEDYAAAFECNGKAAEGEEQVFVAYVACQNGYMYRDGTGVEQDYAKAMEWYEKAADLGSTIAMNNIGQMYEYGLGVKQDSDKAQEWYDKAAAAEGETH